MAYTKIEFITDQGSLIIPFLDDIPFNGFEETNDGFEAFIESEQFSEQHKTIIAGLRDRFDFSLKESSIEKTNWNKKWEASFTAVEIDDFCLVRADFHKADRRFEHEIVINPKMAFGTGHHATTSGIIKLMNGIDFNGKSVFDYGCGTGILAILAEKMGAKHIEAIDIEEEAVANSLENFKINNCKKIQVSKGDLSVVENKFDVIIANINRNVILASIPTLVSLLNPEGLLFTSGFLNIDYQLIKSSLEENHFLELECSENNAWLCILAKKVN